MVDTTQTRIGSALIRRLADARTPSEVLRIVADEAEGMEDDEITWPTSKALHGLAGELDNFLSFRESETLPLFEGEV
jgi:hypothetical protein